MQLRIVCVCVCVTNAYIYVIFWEQSGQADVENGAMLTTNVCKCSDAPDWQSSNWNELQWSLSEVCELISKDSGLNVCYRLFTTFWHVCKWHWATKFSFVSASAVSSPYSMMPQSSTSCTSLTFYSNTLTAVSLFVFFTSSINFKAPPPHEIRLSWTVISRRPRGVADATGRVMFVIAAASAQWSAYTCTPCILCQLTGIPRSPLYSRIVNDNPLGHALFTQWW